MTKPNCPTEAVEQTHLIRWADHHWFGKYLFAIPNGGLRNKIVAAKLKGQGVRAGIPDLFLAIPVPRFRIATTDSDDAMDFSRRHNCSTGLFIEMKRKEGGKVSKKQKEYMNRLEGVGYEVKLCKGWIEAAKAICDYLGEKCDV